MAQMRIKKREGRKEGREEGSKYHLGLKSIYLEEFVG